MKINEITQSKISAIKPGNSATVDHGDGTKTVVDLKKNPNALVKDPTTKKIKLQKKPKMGTKADPAELIRPGDQVDTDET